MKLMQMTILLILIAGSAVADISPDRFDDLLGEQWYGIYMRDGKIGYASIGLKRKGKQSWTMTNEQVFTFSMNQVSVTMTSSENRVYEGENAELISSNYINSSSAGEITVEGKIIDGDFVIITNIAGQTSEKRLNWPIESLDDALRIQLAAISGSLSNGNRFQFRSFVADPPLTGIVEHIITVLDKSSLVIGGVDTDVFVVRDSIPSLMIGSNATIDQYGNTLVMELPSMAMIMKSEPKEMAQRIELDFDLLKSNLIIAPDGPAKPDQITTGRFILSGFQIDRLPESDWVNINKLSADSAEITITQSANDSYDLTIPIKSPAYEEFLKPEQLIQSDNEMIINLARNITGYETNAFKATQLINTWVYKNIKKEFSPDISNALQTLKTGRGDCGEHSALAAALLRAVGIPSRIAAGVVYWPEGGGFAFHAWVEVYVGEWIQIDPTLNQELADPTHIMLARGGLKDHLIALLGALNNIKINILSYG